MPRGDGTGPAGQGTRTDRGSGMGQGGKGRKVGNRPGTSPGNYCMCPNCGEKVTHERGKACYEMICPKCGSQMMRG